jgi:poly(hydroxyalkanoate) granule-associated protein
MATKKKVLINTGLKESAYEVWLAGLGAFNMAGEEGGKLFKQLVEKGREQEESNKVMLSGLTERAQGLREDAKSALSKVTSPIEEGLATAMQRLGVPTRAEIVKLTHRVEELTKLVQQARATGQAKAAGHAKPKPRTRTARA